MAATMLRRLRHSIVVFVLFAAIFLPDNVDAQESNCTLDPTQFGGVGDGQCDGYLNTVECGYDGGDCCGCTCVDDNFPCGDADFVCLDPSCPDEAFEYTTCPGDIYMLGDGVCNDDNNFATCGYDGGDCCECTCVDSTYFTCGDFECLDPSCPDEVLEQALLYPNCTGTVSTTGSGFCSPSNNNPSCGYDGGDCCECTCVDGPDYSCGENGINCLDPACPDEVSPYLDTCTGDVLKFSDSRCDEENNNASCEYDGGDCCACTCVDTATQPCGLVDFPCVDPDAASEFFDCIEEPIVTPCPEDVQSDWVVEDTAAATALAEAVICSGGMFTVEWIGTVWVNRTILVPSGTVLNVTGSGSEAGLDGSTSLRLFTVTNGSLHLTNLHLSNGRSALGGAIAASGSSVVLDTITFAGNHASDTGGALYMIAETLISWSGTTQFIGNVATNRGGGGAFYDGSRATWTGETAFFDNSADNGGALYAIGGSSISCNGTTMFANNSADDDGGALYASSKSLVTGSGDFAFLGNTGWRGGALYIENFTDISWDGDMTFDENSVGFGGGGAYVDSGSSILWNGDLIFSDNEASSGGALFVSGTSSVSWGGNTTSLANSNASNGGALYVEDGSSISWTGHTSFVGNRAYSEGTASTFFEPSDAFGGALYVDGSNISGAGETTFSMNSANVGGALVVDSESNVFWTGTITFFGNEAEEGPSGEGRAGAIYAAGNSHISWDGSTTFAENIALSGGGVFATENSTLSWSGKTTFSRNRARISGAAIVAHDGSTFSWEADTTFADNVALDSGGAVYTYDRSSSVSWSARTTYDNNTADYGGAIFMGYDSTVAWNEQTEFVSNTAHFNGGAIGSSVSDVTQTSSSILVNGTTMFTGNKCGASGGGIAVAGALLITFQTTDITFSENAAEVAGGAVFVSGPGIGLLFSGVKFFSNSAQTGGAVYTTGSGTTITKDENENPQENPSTSDRCEFIGNIAKATGGAVESGAGLDLFNNTLFEGNRAGVGGALRLGGTATLDNCSFVENTSDDEQGPAVSNIGFISSISETTFSHNVFSCESTMFLEYDNALVALYETVCNGCATLCTTGGCDIVGQEPSCSDQLEHSNSTGGDVNVTTLLIEEGYWRATTTSKEIFECFNTDACQGGITGSSGYCSDGYTGPYCSICSDGYAAGAQNTCTECSDNAGGVVLLVVVAILTVLAAVTFLYHLVSTEMEGDERGLLARVTKRIPFHSFKIVIVTWQILTQFTDIANVIYPDVYSEFLDGVALLNFDLGWVLSAACVVDTDFHDRLLISTIAPLVCVAILGATYAIAMRRNRGSDAGRANVRHRHLSMLLFLTFFVYSSVTSTLFRMFACEKLDDGNDFLRADYQIKCDSAKHEALQVYTGFMIALYTVGIPLAYATLLLRNREVLADKARRTQDQHVNAISDLWEPYKPGRFYYEVVECGRRVLLAGVVVFIYPNTAAQVAVALMMAVFFVFLSEGLAPYESRWDAWLSRTGHAIVFTSMYLALLLKVDVSGERASSQRVFEVVLVTAHACMAAAVVVEAIVVGLHLGKKNVEDPEPKFHGCSGVVSFLECRGPENTASAGEFWPGNTDDEMKTRSHVEECKKS